MGIQDIIIFLGAIIIASLIIGFFLSQQLNRKYEDAKKNDANREEDLLEKVASKAGEKFVELARKSQKDIRDTAEDMRKVEDAGKKQLHNMVESLTKAVNNASSKWDADTSAIKNDLQNLTTSHTQWAEALTNPGNQGGMAEESLQMLLEAASFEDGIHFKMQPREVNEDGETLIPDCYIFLPDDGVFIIDSKAPMTHYKRAFETTDLVRQEEHLTEHARSYITYARSLKKKDYTSAVKKRNPDHIFMFVPNAAVYLAAVQSIPDLDERVRALGVSICPPQMLYAALKTVWVSWKEQQVNENMKDVQELVYKFQDYARIYFDHQKKLEDNIRSLNKTWDKSVSSYKRNLGPTLVKIEEKIGISKEKKSEPPELIDENNRSLDE
jgi:DNA anti-recombination protein RmuC